MMIKKIILSFIMIILLCGYNPTEVEAASNPYSGGHGNCTWTAWQLGYDNTGVALPGWGNAGTWYNSAQNAGYSVGSVPRAKSIAVWTNNGYGHVAYVESVSGNTMYIKEGGYLGGYHEDTVSSVVGQDRYPTSATYNDYLAGFIYLEQTTPAGYTGISASKGIYDVNDTVSISVWSTNATIHVIGIDKEGVGRVVTQNSGSTYTVSASALGVGEYSAYFSVANGAGGVDTTRVQFMIAQKENLGQEFYANIQSDISKNHFAVNDANNVELATTSNTEREQWRFERQSDGSYKIYSVWNNKCLDVFNASASLGANVWTYDAWGTNNNAQEWDVFKKSTGEYVIKSQLGDFVIDLQHGNTGQGSNVQLYSYNGTSAQEFNIEKIDTYSAEVSGLKATGIGEKKVKLSWNKISDADGYLIYGKKAGQYGYVGMTTSTQFTDTKALDDEYNFYWVYPYINVGGERIIAVTNKYVYAKGVTSAVVNLKASSVNGGVKLDWQASTDADGYLVYGIVNGEAYGYVGMTTKGTTFTDTKASETQYNFYWVYPYHLDQSGKRIIGGKPNYVYAKAAPSAVTNLKASSVSGGVKLSWNASAGADGYLVYGMVNGGSYGYVGMTTKGTTYTDMKASKTKYSFYWVYPYEIDGSGKRIIGGKAHYTYGKAL